MVCFPNAKINLGLNVVEKRADGFHNIETVFYPVQWSDALEVIKAQGPSIKTEGASDKANKIVFTSSGIVINDTVENNLCVKAFHLLDTQFNFSPIQMHLHKIIPMGAGLGGGSADAAFALKLLNTVFDLKLSNDALKNYAARLGSDCSFFIDNVSSFASGKGDVLEKISLNLKGYYILIVKPGVHVSTADAYNMIVPRKPFMSLKDTIRLPVAEWRNVLKNDFEETVFKKFPAVEALKNKLYKQGAVYASMSGSGSAVFGIFNSNAFDKNEFKDCIVWDGVLN